MTHQKTQHSFEMKKQWGQNFLINGSMQLKVVKYVQDMIHTYPSISWLMEIGLGRGDISQHLVDFSLPYVGIEIDPESIASIRTQAYAHRISLLHTDALALLSHPRTQSSNILSPHLFPAPPIKPPQIPPQGILFSALPYNVGSRILIEWALHYPDIPFVVILQKEVVKKADISKKLTVFGLFLSLLFDLEMGTDIAAGNFYPAPRVTSKVLCGKPKSHLSPIVSTEESRIRTLSIVKHILAYPNKTLANNIKSFGWSNLEISNFLHSHNIEPHYRLSPDSYIPVIESIYNRIYHTSPDHSSSHNN